MADAFVRTRGATIHIGTTAGTASSDTYTKIDGARALEGPYGQTWSQIDATVLDDEFKQTMKGVADAGTLTIGGPVKRDPADGFEPGQAALKAACEDAADPDIYNIKIVAADGRIEYLKVRVMSFTTQKGTNGNLHEFRSQLMLQGRPVEAAAA